MSSDLNRKLRRWEMEDEAEEVRNGRIGAIERIRTSNSRLDMLLGSAITFLVLFVCVLFLRAAGVI